MSDSNPSRQSLVVIRSRRVVLPDGVAAASVRIREGMIESIGPYQEVSEDCRLIDAGSDVVMPGLVDTHVHINEPGRSDWEGFETATRSDADIVVWDPHAEFRVDPETLLHRHKLTPYAGHQLKGIVRQTYLRGEKIYDQGLVIAEPRGKILLRTK